MHKNEFEILFICHNHYRRVKILIFFHSLLIKGEGCAHFIAFVALMCKSIIVMKKKIIGLILAVLLFASAIGSYAFAIEDTELPDNISTTVYGWRDASETRTINITKKIPVQDVDWVHGNPTFVFSIRTVETLSTSVEAYNIVIEFERDTATVVDGYYVQSAAINVSPDIYFVSEYNPLRYETVSISTPAESTGTLVSFMEGGAFKQADSATSEAVYFDLAKGDGAAFFESAKTNWGRASHTAVVINQIGY
jgi:hypothetical protein